MQECAAEIPFWNGDCRTERLLFEMSNIAKSCSLSWWLKTLDCGLFKLTHFVIQWYIGHLKSWFLPLRAQIILANQNNIWHFHSYFPTESNDVLPWMKMLIKFAASKTRFLASDDALLPPPSKNIRTPACNFTNGHCGRRRYRFLSLSRSLPSVGSFSLTLSLLITLLKKW